MVEVYRKPGGTISHVETGRQPKGLDCMEEYCRGSRRTGGMTNDELGSSHAHRMHRWGNRLKDGGQHNNKDKEGILQGCAILARRAEDGGLQHHGG